MEGRIEGIKAVLRAQTIKPSPPAGQPTQVWPGLDEQDRSPFGNERKPVFGRRRKRSLGHPVKEFPVPSPEKEQQKQGEITRTYPYGTHPGSSIPPHKAKQGITPASRQE